MESTRFAHALREIRKRRNLSQLELGLRAGTSQRHVSFIEQGRSVPGRGIVLRLAEALDLPLRERNDLLLVAGFAPVYPDAPLADPCMRPVARLIALLLEAHMPAPAMVLTRVGDIVAANPALEIFTDGLVSCAINCYVKW